MKTLKSPISRAKLSSWVTITIVMPDCGELAHDGEHLADELRIERRGRLVEEHHLRVQAERAGDRDPLLLAARELRGVVRRPVEQADPLQRRRRLLLRLARDCPSPSAAAGRCCRAPSGAGRG